jgi:hypothetical protein
MAGGMKSNKSINTDSKKRRSFVALLLLPVMGGVSPLGEFMRITFSAKATLYDVRDPDFFWGHSTPIVVTDPTTLRAHGNLKCEECFIPYLEDGSDMEVIIAGTLSGGYLEYHYVEEDGGKYIAITAYSTNRLLTLKEVDVLKEYTYGQWLDGVGSGFQQEYAEQTGYWPEVDSCEEIKVVIIG